MRTACTVRKKSGENCKSTKHLLMGVQSETHISLKFQLYKWVSLHPMSKYSLKQFPPIFSISAGIVTNDCKPTHCQQPPDLVVLQFPEPEWRMSSYEALPASTILVRRNLQK